MKIWLRSHERHELFAVVDAETAGHALHEKAALGDKAPKRCNGFFATLGGTFVALYRDGREGGTGPQDKQRLTLQLATTRHTLSDDTKVAVTGPATERVLTVRRGAEVLATHRYTVPAGPDPTAAITEGVDFGLAIANISNSQRRRDVLLGRD
jgi:hypothetical protein